jgi:hypothetical protein
MEFAAKFSPSTVWFRLMAGADAAVSGAPPITVIMAGTSTRSHIRST